MRHRTRIALLLASLLPGCYSHPPTGEIMVDTTPPGASCVISQSGAPLSIAEPTPAMAVVTLTDAEIGIVCRRPGFAEAAVTIPRPPEAQIRTFFPDPLPEVEYNTRIDITMVPAGAALAP
jgi:hypothetical protein